MLILDKSLVFSGCKGETPSVTAPRRGCRALPAVLVVGFWGVSVRAIALPSVAPR